ncbi:hypothetical protein [Lacrimispora indolis]|nr:hypothetical protein [Lacrimispora indolis]
MSNVEIVFMVIKFVVFLYAAWKFVTGDKEKISTLWYGIFLIGLLL